MSYFRATAVIIRASSLPWSRPRPRPCTAPHRMYRKSWDKTGSRRVADLRELARMPGISAHIIARRGKKRWSRLDKGKKKCKNSSMTHQLPGPEHFRLLSNIVRTCSPWAGIHSLLVGMLHRACAFCGTEMLYPCT